MCWRSCTARLEIAGRSCLVTCHRGQRTLSRTTGAPECYLTKELVSANSDQRLRGRLMVKT